MRAAPFGEAAAGMAGRPLSRFYPRSPPLRVGDPKEGRRPANNRTTTRYLPHAVQPVKGDLWWRRRAKWRRSRIDPNHPPLPRHLTWDILLYRSRDFTAEVFRSFSVKEA